ncbi:MAG: hypothetical protein EZS28_034724, partial [Streblomastix strix]
VPLFVNQAGSGTLTAVQISQLVKKTMKLAGINTDYFKGYSAKASGISTRYQEGLSISEVTNKSRLFQKRDVLQKHYLKPLQKIKQQTNYTDISSSEYSHLPFEYDLTINTSRPSTEWSTSVDSNETIEANYLPQKWDLRYILMKTMPIRFQD